MKVYLVFTVLFFVMAMPSSGDIALGPMQTGLFIIPHMTSPETGGPMSASRNCAEMGCRRFMWAKRVFRDFRRCC